MKQPDEKCRLKKDLQANAKSSELPLETTSRGDVVVFIIAGSSAIIPRIRYKDINLYLMKKFRRVFGDRIIVLYLKD